jgi:hypothetical protein
VRLSYVDSPPATVWLENGGQGGFMEPEAVRPALVSLCASALGCRVPRCGHRAADDGVQIDRSADAKDVAGDEYACSSSSSSNSSNLHAHSTGSGDGRSSACSNGRDSAAQLHHQQCRRLLLFNLFALEGYHLAEALSVRAAVVQPYTIPYSAPGSFPRRFQAALPRLSEALRAVQHQQHQQAAAWHDDDTDGDAGGYDALHRSIEGREAVTWADVRLAAPASFIPDKTIKLIISSAHQPFCIHFYYILVLPSYF